MSDKVLPIRRVLIFGGAGFIGSNWADRLLRTTDAQVHIYDNLSRRGVHHNLKWLQKTAAGSDRLQITIGDIRDSAMVQHAARTATEIYHFAAQVAVTSSVSDPRHDFEINVGGTLNILEAARKTGRRPLVLFTSTNKVYGGLAASPLISNGRRYELTPSNCISEAQPLDFHSPYGCSKGAADQYVHDYARIYDLPTVVFRMSCIAGPRQFGNEDQGWVAHFLYSALRNEPVTIYGDGRQVRDVLAVEDLIRGFEIVRADIMKTAGQVYNIGGGPKNATSLLELVNEVERLTGQRLRYELQPPRAGDQPIYIADFSKFREHTGWKPRMNVEQILVSIYCWWRQNRDLFGAASSVPRLALSDLLRAPGAVS
jgi:CDP-paratose 2-epimerase